LYLLHASTKRCNVLPLYLVDVASEQPSASVFTAEEDGVIKSRIHVKTDGRSSCRSATQSWRQAPRGANSHRNVVPCCLGAPLLRQSGSVLPQKSPSSSVIRISTGQKHSEDHKINTGYALLSWCTSPTSEWVCPSPEVTVFLGYTYTYFQRTKTL